MPCPIVGARTVMPRTKPLYSRMRRFWMSNVVDTSMDDWIAMRTSVNQSLDFPVSFRQSAARGS